MVGILQGTVLVCFHLWAAAWTDDEGGTPYILATERIKTIFQHPSPILSNCRSAAPDPPDSSKMEIRLVSRNINSCECILC